MKPRIVETRLWSPPAASSAPTIDIAEIAFVADIRGVWRRGGTRVITRNPTNPANTKTKSFRNWFASASFSADARSAMVSTNHSLRPQADREVRVQRNRGVGYCEIGVPSGRSQ